MMTELHRDNRDMPSLCVTCAGQFDRDERDTPLGGVTFVTLARVFSDLVPIPPFPCRGETACPTVPFSLPILWEKFRGVV